MLKIMSSICIEGKHYFFSTELEKAEDLVKYNEKSLDFDLKALNEWENKVKTLRENDPDDDEISQLEESIYDLESDILDQKVKIEQSKLAVAKLKVESAKTDFESAMSKFDDSDFKERFEAAKAEIKFYNCEVEYVKIKARIKSAKLDVIKLKAKREKEDLEYEKNKLIELENSENIDKDLFDFYKFGVEYGIAKSIISEIEIEYKISRLKSVEIEIEEAEEKINKNNKVKDKLKNARIESAKIKVRLESAILALYKTESVEKEKLLKSSLKDNGLNDDNITEVSDNFDAKIECITNKIELEKINFKIAETEVRLKSAELIIEKFDLQVKKRNRSGEENDVIGDIKNTEIEIDIRKANVAKIKVRIETDKLIVKKLTEAKIKSKLDSLKTELETTGNVYLKNDIITNEDILKSNERDMIKNEFKLKCAKLVLANIEERMLIK